MAAPLVTGRGRAVQGVAAAGDAGPGPAGAARRGDARLEHGLGPRLGPRAAPGRLAHPRARRLDARRHPGHLRRRAAGGAGGAVTLPVQVIRAEDLGTDITLSIDAGAPFGASIEPDTLTSQDGDSASLSITVPASTPSGTYKVKVRASDGTRVRTSEYPVVVDSVAPVNGAPTLRLRTGTVLTGPHVAGQAAWPAASDAGSGVLAYQYRWRLDGTLGGTTRVGSTTLAANRSLATGHRYALLVRAQDRAGNWSGWKESAAFSPSYSQDTSPTLHRSRGWAWSRRRELSGGSSLSSTHRGASLTRTFTGRAVGLVVTKGPLRGRAQVWIDGSLAATIDTHRSKNQFRRPRLHRPLGHVRATHAPRRRGRDPPPATGRRRRLRDRPVGVTSAAGRERVPLRGGGRVAIRSGRAGREPP